MCIFQLWSVENYTSKFRSHLRHKISCSFSPSPSLIFSFLQALIHGFLWWWASSWLIFSLKWRLQLSFILLHSATIDLQEAKDFIDEEDPRPTSSTWSYITFLENTSLSNKWRVKNEKKNDGTQKLRGGWIGSKSNQT